DVALVRERRADVPARGQGRQGRPRGAELLPLGSPAAVARRGARERPPSCDAAGAVQVAPQWGAPERRREGPDRARDAQRLRGSAAGAPARLRTRLTVVPG